MIEEWKEYYHDFAGDVCVAYLVVGGGAAVAGVAAGDEAQRRGAETVKIHIQGLSDDTKRQNELHIRFVSCFL